MLGKCLCVQKQMILAVAATVCFLLVVGVSDCLCLERSEVLRYEVTWNGNKAGHGDIATKKDSKQISVIAQAVTDGVLKTLVELWSRVQATFSANTFKPQSYSFQLKSNLGGPELIDLTFDHKTNLVQVNKQKGSERESHSEKFSGQCDPITAAFMLRHQKDLGKPMFVDIYDGKDKSRLFVNPTGVGYVTVKAGSHSAYCLNLRLVKLGGDKQELGTGKLWISNDEYRIPLLLTSSPILGTIRFELVQAQL
ncbi:MAG: DUF3108 domain-containing protein [Desulfomonilaceae bacterium]